MLRGFGESRPEARDAAGRFCDGEVTKSASFETKLEWCCISYSMSRLLE